MLYRGWQLVLRVLGSHHQCLLVVAASHCHLLLAHLPHRLSQYPERCICTCCPCAAPGGRSGSSSSCSRRGWPTRQRCPSTGAPRSARVSSALPPRFAGVVKTVRHVGQARLLCWPRELCLQLEAPPWQAKRLHNSFLPFACTVAHYVPSLPIRCSAGQRGGD